MVVSNFLELRSAVAQNLLSIEAWEASVNCDCSESSPLNNFGGYK